MRLLSLALIILTMWCGLLPASAADAPKKIRVLLLTGDDVSPAHPWLEVASATREVLLSSGRFEVDVCIPTMLESAKSVQRYDVIYLSYYNARTPTLSDAAKETLVNFVKGGKGFVVTHLSSASFKEWDEFKKLCGRYWVMGKSGHGPRSTFQVKIAKQDHPITQGAEGFETDDELYAKLLGDGPINVLAEADSNFSNKTEPLAFTLEYGQGRVFHHTFGHDGKAIEIPGVQRLIQRGTEWAATGKVQ